MWVRLTALRRSYHIMGGRKAATSVKVDVGIIISRSSRIIIYAPVQGRRLRKSSTPSL
jgi:hypothetical protein